MNAKPMLIAASLIALAGVAAMPIAAASPPQGCSVSILVDQVTWTTMCAQRDDIVQYCATSSEIQDSERAACLEHLYFGIN